MMICKSKIGPEYESNDVKYNDLIRYDANTELMEQINAVIHEGEHNFKKK